VKTVRQGGIVLPLGLSSLPQPHPNALPAFRWDESYASVFKGARFNSSLARASRAGRWIDFTPQLDRLRYFGKPSAFTSGAFDFCYNIFWFRSFQNHFLE
jgi:hypothetical protein